MEEFYKVSTCKNGKEVWEALEKAQERIEEPDHNSLESSTTVKMSRHASKLMLSPKRAR